MTLTFTNDGHGIEGTNDVPDDDPWGRLHALIEKLYPVKTAFHLADITGLSVSAWQKSLREKRSLSADALLSLLRAPFGKQVLEALMGDADTRWFAEFQLMWDEAQLEAKRQELVRRREALREKL